MLAMTNGSRLCAYYLENTTVPYTARKRSVWTIRTVVDSTTPFLQPGRKKILWKISSKRNTQDSSDESDCSRFITHDKDTVLNNPTVTPQKFNVEVLVPMSKTKKIQSWGCLLHIDQKDYSCSGQFALFFGSIKVIDFLFEKLKFMLTVSTVPISHTDSKCI
jgi:hypothetical protein